MPRMLFCGCTSNHCLCLSLPAAFSGSGALQLCAPAFFLQGLLQTVLESVLLKVLVPRPPPENGEPGPQHIERTVINSELKEARRKDETCQ